MKTRLLAPLLSALLLGACAAPPEDAVSTDEGAFTSKVATISAGPGHDVAGSEIASLVLDGSGKPHVALQTSAEKIAWATTKADGSWNVEVVDPNGNNGRFARIALDASGRPVVLYYGSQGETRFATRSPNNTWSSENIQAGASPQALLVVGGTPHVLVRSGYNELFYGTRTANGWTFATTGLSTYQDASLVVGANGAPQVVTLVAADPADPYGDRNLVVAKPGAVGWTQETIAGPGRLYGPSAGLDAQGRLHVAYSFTNQPNFGWQARYSVRNGTQWSAPVNIGLLGGGSSSLAIDGAGRVHVAETVDKNARIASQNQAGGWTVSSALPVSYYAGPPSLAIDASGKRHLAFHEYLSFNNARYRYAND